MTGKKRDTIEARIARRLTANWTAIRRGYVTPLGVARDIIEALQATGTLPLPSEKTEPSRD